MSSEKVSYIIIEVDLNSNIGKNENEIIKNIIDFTEKNVMNNQMIMQKEIEDYLTKNMEEMYKGLEQLRLSIEEEIKIMEGKKLFNPLENGYPDVVKGLREDMVSELDTLKEQYEEERSNTIEKIKQKYSKLR